MEEAGRTLGDGPVRAFARLTVPYLRPAFVAGAALVFLTVVKELPLALLLAPIGFETLATEIWDAASRGLLRSGRGAGGAAAGAVHRDGRRPAAGGGGGAMIVSSLAAPDPRPAARVR